MLSLAVAVSLAFQQPVSAKVGRYEMGERLKVLDRAWVTESDRARRANAVPRITRAVTAFFSSNFGDACRALDEATAALEGRPVNAADAITLRFDPPFAEPKSNASLKIGWAYDPGTSSPVRVSVGNQSVLATPGRELTLTFRPESVNSDLLLSPEAGVVIPVQVGGDQRGVYLSVVKRFRDRLKPLLTSRNRDAQFLANAVEDMLKEPEALETDLPLIEYLFTAELLHEGRATIDRLDEIPLVQHGNTRFRIAFPPTALGARGRQRPVNVVIALHGAGGSENMFFDAYGNGLGATLALRRSWVFVSPRTGATAVADVLAWLRGPRRLNVGRVFLMGHSMGGGVALSAAESMRERPAAMALFAPAARAIPSSLASVPTYLAVGKQEIPMLATSARTMGQGLQGRRDAQFQEFDPSEHLMVVTDALPAAFRFFDQFAR